MEPIRKRQRIEPEYQEELPPPTSDAPDGGEQANDPGFPDEINSDDDLFRTVAAVVGMPKDDPRRAPAVSRIDAYLSSPIGQTSDSIGGQQPMTDVLGETAAI